MLFQEYKFAQKLFLDKNVLEIGCNQGLTTTQISKFAKNVTAIDNNHTHINNAKIQKIKKNIRYLQIDFFDKKKMSTLGKFEIIYLREIFNFLEFKKKEKLIEILLENLSNNGKIIVTDFYSKVFFRKKIINFVKLNFVKLFKDEEKAKIFHFKNNQDLKNFSLKYKMNFSIIKKDPLTEHIKFLTKFIEYVYPCKYTIILTK